jgi:hypothetical protein
MNRHPFDPIALVLGALVCVAGAVAVADADPDVGSLPRWLVPLVVIAVGSVMVFGAMIRTNRQPATLSPAESPAGQPAPTVQPTPADEAAPADEPPADAV